VTFDWNGGAFVSLPLIKAWSGGYFLPFSTNGLQGVAPLCLIQDWGDGPGGYLAEGIVTWTAGPLILLGACEADARGTAAFTGTILLPGSFEADGHAGLNASAVIPPSTIGLAEPSSPLSILWGMGGAVYLAGGAIATWTAAGILPAAFGANARATAAFGPVATLAGGFEASAQATATFTGPLAGGAFSASAEATAAFVATVLSSGSTITDSFAANARATAKFGAIRNHTAAVECDGVATAIFYTTLLGAGPPPNPLSAPLIPWPCEIGTDGTPTRWQAGLLTSGLANSAL
jgi:hypothetical protein